MSKYRVVFVPGVGPGSVEVEADDIIQDDGWIQFDLDDTTVAMFNTIHVLYFQRLDLPTENDGASVGGS